MTGRIRKPVPYLTAEDTCGHSPEAHVVWDPDRAGFVGAAWCRCRKIEVRGRWARKTHAEAHSDSTAIAQIATDHGEQGGKSKGRRLGAQGPGR